MENLCYTDITTTKGGHPMTFAQRVKIQKTAQHMTTEELSRESGVPCSTLNKILSGAIEEPRLSVALAIARAFGCPLEALTGEGRASELDRTRDESRILRKYRRLDESGRELTELIIDKELSRMDKETEVPEMEGAEEIRMITLPLYMLPVSAGMGTWLDDSGYCETIDVRATKVSLGADYALRVSGNSMEPKFSDGDILLVKRQSEVAVGDLGIFVADGEGYFKRYTGEYLHSFNPAFQDILIANFSEFRCCGKVIGQMKRRRLATG